MNSKKKKAAKKIAQRSAEQDMQETLALKPSGYDAFLRDLKERIHAARVRAALAANRELIALYWHIGKSIVERQRSEGWGKSVVDRLAADLQREFPGMEGFSPRNIWRMRSFYLAWTEEVGNLSQPVAELNGKNLPQLVAEIPWGHNVWLLEKLKDPATRLWYAAKTVEHGWSRNVLSLQIEANLHKRQGRAITNFEQTLPPLQSDLAQQALKDPYVFDFLTLGADAREKELE
jgi:predicted nuclease of restriction endonuclease-like (RecB) superfamily